MTKEEFSTPEAERDYKKFKKAMDKKYKMKKTKKIYCEECKYCGEIVNYYPNIPQDMKEGGPHHRYCENPKVDGTVEYDTWYEHVRYINKPMTHKINKNNDCKYFKRKK